MAKRKLTFKVGLKYRHRKTGVVYSCEIDYHPWDRTKRLCKVYPSGVSNVIESRHVSQFDRNDFVISK